MIRLHSLTSGRARCSSSSTSLLSAAPTSSFRPTTPACGSHMSSRRNTTTSSPRRRTSGGAISVWLIALLVALIATVQIRSEAEVARSLVGIDTTSLAFLIDDLHRANDSLQAEAADLQARQATLRSRTSGAADHVLNDAANRLPAIEGPLPAHRPGV